MLCCSPANPPVGRHHASQGRRGQTPRTDPQLARGWPAPSASQGSPLAVKRNNNSLYPMGFSACRTTNASGAAPGTQWALCLAHSGPAQPQLVPWDPTTLASSTFHKGSHSLLVLPSSKEHPCELSRSQRARRAPHFSGRRPCPPHCPSLHIGVSGWAATPL